MAYFGSNSTGSPGTSLDNAIYGLRGQCTENATADSISVYLETSVDVGTGKIKCALYVSDGSGNPTTFIQSTEERTVDNIDITDGTDWRIFTFSEPKPTLVAETWYYISVWASSTDDIIETWRTTLTGTYSTYTNSETYGTWPATETATPDTTSNMAIYCNYSPTDATVAETNANRKGAIFLDSSKNLGSDGDKAMNQYIKTWDFTDLDKKPGISQKTKDFGS